MARLIHFRRRDTNGDTAYMRLGDTTCGCCPRVGIMIHCMSVWRLVGRLSTTNHSMALISLRVRVSNTAPSGTPEAMNSFTSLPWMWAVIASLGDAT